MRNTTLFFICISLLITGCHKNNDNNSKSLNDHRSKLKVRSLLKENQIMVGNILLIKKTPNYTLVFHQVDHLLYLTLFTESFKFISNNYFSVDDKDNYTFFSGNLGEKKYRVHYLFGIVNHPDMEQVVLKDFHETQTRSFTTHTLPIDRHQGIRFFNYFPPYPLGRVEIHGTDSQGGYYTVTNSMQ